MVSFKAKVTEDVPSNRLLTLKTEKRSGEDEMVLSVAHPGEAPDFRSTGDLKADTEVSVTIKDAPVWEVEAGEDIAVGSYVESGESGVVVSADDGFGYAVESVKAGNVAKVVRRPSGSDGDPGKPGKNGKSAYQIAKDSGFEGTKDEWLSSLKGPQGDPGKNAEPQFTEEEVTALKGLITDGE